MLVTDDRLLAGRDPVALARAAVAGGVTAVQLRLKEASARELVALAARLTAALPVPVLVNDRPDVAAAAGCGVHLGPDDLPVSFARRILRPGTIIGGCRRTSTEATPAPRVSMGPSSNRVPAASHLSVRIATMGNPFMCPPSSGAAGMFWNRRGTRPAGSSRMWAGRARA